MRRQFTAVLRESVTDRPTKAHEYVFLLTKNERYWYDAAAIREPYAASTLTQFEKPYGGLGMKDYAACAERGVRPQGEPCRLWSLWDMLRHYAGNWLAVDCNLERLKWQAAAMSTAPASGDTDYRRDAGQVIRILRAETADLPFSQSLNLQIERLCVRLEESERKDYDRIIVMIDEITQNIQTELSEHLFLCVPSQYRMFYEQPQPLFGNDVENEFAHAKRDIAAAGRCLALDEWTACVFHLMRVLEHGLRRFAATVGLPADAMERQNWQNVIDQIEKKIRELNGAPNTPGKAEKLTTYSATATQFRYFKDAWRNHVSHARTTYDPREAGSIYTHVKEFMQDLAKA